MEKLTPRARLNLISNMTIGDAVIDYYKVDLLAHLRQINYLDSRQDVMPNYEKQRAAVVTNIAFFVAKIDAVLVEKYPSIPAPAGSLTGLDAGRDDYLKKLEDWINDVCHARL